VVEAQFSVHEVNAADAKLSAPGRRELAASHSPSAVAERLRRGPPHSPLRDLVYGAIDGTVTTFAVVAGARGASLSASVVFILGVVNLIADGFSMAASNYLGVRADEQRRRCLWNEELTHISLVPEGEREEVRQIFGAKGFRDEDLDRVVQVITSDRERWVQTMLTEEHGLSPAEARPLASAVATFVAFVVVGFVPIAPFAIDAVTAGEFPAAFGLSALLTGLAFLAVGVARGHVVRVPHWRAALETLAVGGAAAGLAYSAGAVLSGVV
jgi:vacuolar iron transporter family protein